MAAHINVQDVLACLGVAGGVVTVAKPLWDWRERRRVTLPIILWNGDRMKIINRADEPLTITRITTPGKFFADTGHYDPAGHFVPGQELTDEPKTPGWTILPSRELIEQVRALPDTCVVEMSCNSWILRRRRKTVHKSTQI